MVIEQPHLLNHWYFLLFVQQPQTPNKLNDISEIIGREGVKLKAEPSNEDEGHDELIITDGFSAKVSNITRFLLENYAKLKCTGSKYQMTTT